MHDAANQQRQTANKSSDDLAQANSQRESGQVGFPDTDHYTVECCVRRGRSHIVAKIEATLGKLCGEHGGYCLQKLDSVTASTAIQFPDHLVRQYAEEPYSACLTDKLGWRDWCDNSNAAVKSFGRATWTEFAVQQPMDLYLHGDFASVGVGKDAIPAGRRGRTTPSWWLLRVGSEKKISMPLDNWKTTKPSDRESERAWTIARYPASGC